MTYFQGARHTVELIFKTIARLEPLDDEIERGVVQRVLSTLTHQNMVVEMDILASSNKTILKRTSSDMGLMRTNVASRMLYFFMRLLFLMQKELQEKCEECTGNGLKKESVQKAASKSDLFHKKRSKAQNHECTKEDLSQGRDDSQAQVQTSDEIDSDYEQ